MSTRSSLAARNSHVSKGFRPEQPRAKDLSRSALLLGTALGASIAVFAAATPGTANAQSCTPSVVGGVNTTTCTAGTYPTGIFVEDPGNAVIVNVPTGVTVNDPGGPGVVALGEPATYTNVNIAAGSTISVAGNGIYAEDISGTVSITNGADITAGGRGILSFSEDGSGDIINTGNITVHDLSGTYAVGILTDDGYSYVNNSGAISVTANTLGATTGVYIGNSDGVANIVNSGNITLNNTGTGATIGITTDRYGETADQAYVENNGSINVTGAAYAAGVSLNTYENNSFTGTGDITVAGNTAVGVNLNSHYGDVYGNHTGDISVTGLNGATGMTISGYTLNVTQTGNISVSTGHGDAMGLNVNGYTGTVIINGSINAYSKYGNATGVNAVGNYNYESCYSGPGIQPAECATIKPDVVTHFGPGLATLIYGDVNVFAPLGTATGESMTTGVGEYGYVYVSGNVSAIGTFGSTGVTMTSGGSAYATVGGSVFSQAVDGYATGVTAIAGSGDYTAGVVVGGDLTAEGFFGAIGASASGFDAYVSVGGSIFASAVDGNATGALVNGRFASVDVGGDVTAETEVGNAVGVENVGYYTAFTTIGGSVFAETFEGGAIGILNVATGESSVSVGGEVYAKTQYGNASGVISVSAENYSSVSVGGDVVALSGTGYAQGVESIGIFGSAVTVGGNVIAEGYTSATGVTVISAADDFGASANISGEVFVETVKGNATGVSVEAEGYAYARVGGNVVAETGNGVAKGVYVYAEDAGEYQATAKVYGNVIAIGTTLAYGVVARSYGSADAYVNGSVTAMALNGYAVGVEAESEDLSVASVNGNVTAVSKASEGVFAEGADAYANVGGNVTVVSTAGNATGVEAISDFHSEAYVGGNVLVIAAGGNAYGVVAEALDGNASVTVEGGITVESFGTGTVSIGAAAIAEYNASVVVEGPIVAVGNIAAGVEAVSLDGGTVFVDVGNVSVTQNEGSAYYGGAGIRTFSTGTTHIYAGTVYTQGDYTDGIKAGEHLNGGGNTYVDVYAVKTKGNYSTGVDVYGYGNAGVTSSYIKTYGNTSDGIIAVSKYGSSTVHSGQVVTYGNYSVGIYAAAGGPVNVTSGFVETFGNFAPGVVAINLGTTAGDTVTVNSGTSITHGAYSPGIYAYGYNGVSVTSTYVATHGYESPGIDALSYNGPLSVVSNTVHTYYNSSDGIEAQSLNGSVYVNSNVVTTDGYFSTGIAASSYFGDVTVISNFVHTYYNSSDGIDASSLFGNVTISSNEVFTDGNYSVGIFGESLYGNVSIDSGYVRTLGYSSAGIEGESFLGNVYIDSGTVKTYGNFSPGVVGESLYGNVGISSYYVKTTGYNSYGIIGESYFGNVSILSGTVKTYGDFSPGIVGESLGGNVYIDSGFVKTTGYDSIGIFAYSRYGNVSVDSGTVVTYGDYSTGIHAFSYGGTATVSSGYVKTYGYRAEGIYAYGYNGVTVTSGGVKTYGDYSDGIHAISPNGTVGVTSGYVKTTGTGSVGIYAYGWYGVSVVSGIVKTYGDFAPGIDAISPYGTAYVKSNYVRTQGFESAGIFAYGYYGATVNNTGVVKTYGDYSNGITAEAYAGDVKVTSDEVITHGFDSIGIKAYADFGNVTVNAGLTETYGDDSRGISAVSQFGNVSVTAEETITYGASSNGITAVTDYGGNVYVNSGFVYTYGFESQGIRAHAHNFGGNVVVYSGEVITEGFYAPGIAGLADYGTVLVHSDEVITHGEFSTGIQAEGYFGTKVYSGSVYTTGYDATAIYARTPDGDTLVATYDTTNATHGFGVEAISDTGFVDVYNFGHLFGGYVGIAVQSDLGSYIYNHGSIKGGNGFAIEAFGAPVFIENKGSIYGYAVLNTVDNTINNQGTWFAYGNSYMGGGNDVVNNKGIVRVAPFSGSATTVIWDGVTVFNNSNLVDLRNLVGGGHTGDIFELNGNGGVGTAWNGLPGSTLGVDASLSLALTSDKMIVGAVTGTTQVVVRDVSPGSPGSLNFVGTTVVHGTSGSASNFTMNTIHKGFIDYELMFFSGPVNWNIVALPGQPAFEMLKAPEMAQDFWRRTGDAWSAREQEVRDSMWGSTPPTRGEGWEMWAQAQIGGERVGTTQTFDVQGLTFTPDLRTSSDWRGFQMGGDNWTSKNWLFGFTGGFLEQNSVFNLDKNSFDITGWNVGAYTGFTSGSFFMNGLIKGDWYDVRANMHTVPALETFSGNTWGVKGEAGFRLGTPHLYLEPLADIYWTTTHLDNANFPAQATTFTYGNANSSRGSIGARLGGQWGSIMPYVGLYAVDAFEGDNKMTMITSGGCPAACMSIEDTKPGTYGKADVGFTTTSWNGLEGFLKGEAEFGSHVDGFTGRLGVRWRW